MLIHRAIATDHWSNRVSPGRELADFAKSQREKRTGLGRYGDEDADFNSKNHSQAEARQRHHQEKPQFARLGPYN
jgi:hypothetical protein